MSRYRQDEAYNPCRVSLELVCTAHEGYDVYFLAATTAFMNRQGEETAEESERAVLVTFDMANMYCEGPDDGKDHDIRFNVFDSNGEKVAELS